MKTFSLLLFIFLNINTLFSEEHKAVEIVAETMEWNKQKGQAIATGNAKAIKGNAVIEANTIIAVLDNDPKNQKIVKLLADGNVLFSKDQQIATGTEAIYDLKQDKIIIKGNVNLKKEDNIIKGDKLTIDFKTGLSKMVSSNSNEKVKMKYSTD